MAESSLMDGFMRLPERRGNRKGNRKNGYHSNQELKSRQTAMAATNQASARPMPP